MKGESDKLYLMQYSYMCKCSLLRRLLYKSQYEVKESQLTFDAKDDISAIQKSKKKLRMLENMSRSIDNKTFGYKLLSLFEIRDITPLPWGEA